MSARLILQTPAEVRVEAGQCIEVPSLVGEALSAGRGQLAGTIDGRRIASTLDARGAQGIRVVARVVAPTMSVAAQLAVHATQAQVRAALADCPVLAGRADDPAGVLSGGERQALGWLRATLAPAAVLVLPNAARGMDAANFAWASGLLDRHLSAGGAAVVCSADARERAWSER